MLDKFTRLYIYLFARKRFKKWNNLLLNLSLHGLGVSNYKNAVVSGEDNFLNQVLKNCQGVVVDVGANSGEYSISITKINNCLKIYAFEPHPKNFIDLSENTRGFQNIKVFNQGVSDKNGKINLFDYSDNDGSQHASIYQDVITELHGMNKSKNHIVSVTTIDDFMCNEKIEEIFLLKLDTEGSEFSILNGAKNSINSGKIKVIHFEFNEMNVVSRVYFRDFWKLLKDYKIYRLLPYELLEITEYDSKQCEIFAYQNIIAFHKNNLNNFNY